MFAYGTMGQCDNVCLCNDFWKLVSFSAGLQSPLVYLTDCWKSISSTILQLASDNVEC